MRILHVNKFLYRRGGAEGYMLDVAEMQRAAGHDVEIFGMSHPDNPGSLPLQDTFAPFVELEPPPGGLGALRAASRMVWSRAAERGMTAAIDQFAPDVVHCHNIYHQLSPSVLAATRRAGVRCVMTLHDYKLACPSYQMLDHGKLCDACVGRTPLHAALRRCKSGSLPASAMLSLESMVHRSTNAYDPVDLLISPSRFLAGVMERAGIGRDRLRVINHFVNLDAARPRSADADRGQAYVTFAGRLSSEKGVDTLIRAMTGTRADLHLHVAGDGPQGQDLRQLAQQVAPGRVTFHGRLDKSTLAALVAGSLATVVPSRWYENQPLTILESYAAQVPAVVTALGGMPELVRHDVDGLVVPHDDPSSLGAALETLADDPDRARRMGVAGRERLSAEFAPDLHLQRLQSAYTPGSTDG